MKRREFLKATGQALAGLGLVSGFPTIVPASALGRGGAVSPSNRIVMGSIGIGWMGESNTQSFLEKPDVQMVAICDLEAGTRKKWKGIIDAKYGDEGCEAYTDFRELLDRPDLDAVTLALPDHWHAIPAITALKKGLDVYGEKPFSRTLGEGRAMVNAVERYGRVWQTGSWQRSRDNFHKACELVRNGRVGKIVRVEVGIGGGANDFNNTGHLRKPMEAPDGFNYDMWLGPAPYTPYIPARLHKNWRHFLDYGGGQLLDWVGHHVDIAHWGLGLDETGPVNIQATGYLPSGIWNAPTQFDVMSGYANGVEINIASTLKSGTKWIAENGNWLHVDRGTISAGPTSILDERIGAEEVQLRRSLDHYEDFLTSVKTRRTTLTPAETAHRSASTGHLGLIAILTGRKLKFDPVTEKFDNDPGANDYVHQPMRAPWILPV